MTPQDFVYWLQGYIELQDPKTINEQQVQIIKDHIALVLKKETPKIVPMKPWTSTPPNYWGGWSGGVQDALVKTTFGGSC